MSNILILIFGVMITFVGFRMYSYYDKNLENIDDEPAKLYNKAVMVIITGVLLTLASITQFF